MKYRSVWFDLGMTLVRTPVEELYQDVLKTFGLVKEPEKIRRAFYLADKTFMKNYPHILGGPPAEFPVVPWHRKLSSGDQPGSSRSFPYLS